MAKRPPLRRQSVHEILFACSFMLLGLTVGTFGTLIGAGGGFVLMPILLLLYPADSPALLTSISLAVVFFNAASGSEAYSRMGRIDYKTGLIFAAAAVPGAVFGAMTAGVAPRRLFDAVFGAALVAGALFLMINTKRKGGETARNATGLTTRRLVEHDGTVHEYAFRLRDGVLISLGVGYISSFLGIGGGIVHVPALIYILNFPVHIATATSHFILAIMALAGTLVHVASGVFEHGVHRAIFLSIGVLAGAQLGARLSNRVKGRGIILSLALALVFVGLRILFQAFSSKG